MIFLSSRILFQIFTTFEKSILMQLSLTFGENQLWMVSSLKLRQRFAKATRFAALD